MGPQTEHSDGELFVSVDGDDGWSGTRPEPADDGTDGPFRTIQRAREEVRFHRQAGRNGHWTIHVRGGRYELAEPLTFDQGIGNTTVTAYGEETPVISGGREVTGWEPTTVNGVDAWEATPPDDAGPAIRQLWVDGERRLRPRSPDLPDLGFRDAGEFTLVRDSPESDAGFFENIFGSSTEFVVPPEAVEDWDRQDAIEAVFCHYWVGERRQVASIEPDTGRVTLQERTGYGVDTGVTMYFENVFEALSEPGEWYHDPTEDAIYYVPEAGETPEAITAIVPALEELVRIRGDPDDPVSDLRLEGLTFEHARYDHEESPSQGAASLGGAVSLEYARNCQIESCTVVHVGNHGVTVGPGTKQCGIVGNELSDLGAGGIDVDGGRWEAPHRTGHNRITDNHIHDGGRVHHAGVGVLARNVFDTDISYNHVHDMFYTGISCGWEWGFDASVSADNRIEHNHIHDLGKRLLSDMGGIYTLGVQPGTVIRGNHIHDVDHRQYGGWAIYLDEGSSHILVEDNVCHDTSAYALNQHYGRENLVRNNVFAYGDQGSVGLSRDEYTGFLWNTQSTFPGGNASSYGDRYPVVALSRGPRGGAFTFIRNVVIADDRPLIIGTEGEYGSALSEDPMTSEANLFWDEAGDPFCVDAGLHGEYDEEMPLSAWRDRGNDATSIVADPGIELSSDGVAFAEESPVSRIGFDPIELEAGPRPGE